MATSRTIPTLADVEAARERIRGHARVTPVFTSETFSRRTGREILLKTENLQRTGSFKIRGAVNKISTLSPEERAAGVVAASAGNHGQAVAWAAREVGAGATVFMPQDSPMAKVDATKNYGAQVELAGSIFEEAVQAALEHVEQTGATLIHPFEDEAVIAGQGTIALELLEQHDKLETVVVPVGGGGLASGIAIAVKELRPEVRIVGVQAANCAPLAGSEEMGFTIAEGIAVKEPGELTSSILSERADEIVAVTDEEISEALLLCLERVKLLVEGAGAAGLAAVLGDKVPGNGPAAVILSGGNIDPTLLITVMRHGLTLSGRFLVLRTRVPDRPGELAKLLALLGGERVNVISVQHHRAGVALEVGETEVEITVLTRDPEHCEHLLTTMHDWGYPVERVE
ncbi:MAG: threonine ammonia-lyase [Actinomycetota bacterium]|nr:threonine ammonia-lyase [Actinomycetota bacterium]